MENSYILTAEEALKYFGVSEDSGLSDDQARALREKYGSNGIALEVSAIHHRLTWRWTALPEDPPTPVWKLILEQFKDQLVIILLGSAAVSFVLALFEDGDDWTAFVDPLVVRLCLMVSQEFAHANRLGCRRS